MTVQIIRVPTQLQLENYATKAYADNAASTAAAAVIASAPSALNTLDELAAALNDDANFATTITNLLATKITSIPGMISQYAGISAPTGWLFCDGSAVSRSTYSSLFAQISNSFTTATTTNASTTVSGLSGMDAAVHVGWGIAGTNIPTAAKIVSVTNATTVVISVAATGTATGTANIAIGPYGFTGAGNTTTFNLPDLRGRTVSGKDNMGGSTASRITSAISGLNGTILGAVGGDEKLHQHTHPNTVAGTFAKSDHAHYASGQGGDLRAAIGATNNNIAAIGYQTSGWLSPGPTTSTYTITGGIGGAQTFNHYTPVYGSTSGPSATESVSITNANNAQTGASQNVQPTMMLNYIIRY